MPSDSNKMIANFSSIQMIAYTQLIATKKVLSQKMPEHA